MSPRQLQWLHACLEIKHVRSEPMPDQINAKSVIPRTFFSQVPIAQRACKLALMDMRQILLVTHAIHAMSHVQNEME